MTRVVNIAKESFDVYIGRPGKGLHSIWGNPFVIGKDGTRAEVIAKYKEYIISNPVLMNMLPTLKGKTLGCFCKPQACHGDVLVQLLEATNFIKF